MIMGVLHHKLKNCTYCGIFSGRLITLLTQSNSTYAHQLIKLIASIIDTKIPI